MKEKKIKVLHITEELSAAGIESFIMNIYRNINKKEIQFDFLVLRDKKEFYDDEISILGGKKYVIHSDIKNTLLRVLDEASKLETFLKENSYQTVHIHYTTPLRAFFLKAAKNAGVPVRIYHSHSAKVSGKSLFKLFMYSICKKIIDKNATDFFACSKAAADWMFSKHTLNKVIIIYNAIDINRFQFCKDIRERIRKEMNITNEFTIINTGRFTEQKNQNFILEIVSKLKEKGYNIKLILLGDGPLIDDCRNKANKLGLDKVVEFLGVKNNVQDYLFASDCYVMPSLYEGLPVAAIEAECTGIPCILSDTITDEVKLNDNVIFMSLNKSASEWGDIIINKNNVENRKDAIKNIKNSGYDIDDVVLYMQSFYIQRNT